MQNHRATQNGLRIFCLNYLKIHKTNLFILLKILGTFTVIGILYILWNYKSRYGIVVAVSIAIAQCILLFYLVFYDPITYGEKYLIKNKNLYQKIMYRIGGMIGPIPEDVEKYKKSSQP